MLSCHLDTSILGNDQDSGGNGATDDGATCGLMPDCGLVVPIGAHVGAALVSRKT